MSVTFKESYTLISFEYPLSMELPSLHGNTTSEVAIDDAWALKLALVDLNLYFKFPADIWVQMYQVGKWVSNLPIWLFALCHGTMAWIFAINEFSKRFRK